MSTLYNTKSCIYDFDIVCRRGFIYVMPVIPSVYVMHRLYRNIVKIKNYTQLKINLDTHVNDQWLSELPPVRRFRQLLRVRVFTV